MPTTARDIWREETSQSCCHGPPVVNKRATGNQLQDLQTTCTVLHRGAAFISPREGIRANSVQGILLNQLLFYNLKVQLKTCRVLPVKERGLTPVAWCQPTDLGCQKQKSWQWSSYTIPPGTTCASAASLLQHPVVLPGAQMLAPAGGNGRGHKCVKVSHLGSLNPGKGLLLLGQEPIPCNAQQNTAQLTLQSTVPRICLSESLLMASAGFGWAIMCWRLDLAIAFLEDKGGLANKCICKAQPASKM